MKYFKFLLLAFLVFFVGCGNSKDEKNIFRVGATPVPHAEVLEFIKPQLARKNITLKVITFSDYITPNIALNDGSIDANLFQHQPFLQKTMKDRGYDFVGSRKILLVPLGAYSNKIHSLKELRDGDTIIIANDPSNLARSLILLDKFKLIKLKDPTDLNCTQQDIIDNPRKLKLVPIDAGMLANSLGDGVMSIVPGNYALQGKLENPIIQEDRDNPYANVVAVRRGDENNERTKALIEALRSEETRTYLKNKYKDNILLY